MDAWYENNGERYVTTSVHNGTVEVGHVTVVNDLLPAGRKAVLAGRWGSTFWKDCQPTCPPGGSDSGQESKSESGIKYADRSENDSVDAPESDKDDPKEVSKARRGLADIPADEMLSDDYYEQDGEDQSDSVPLEWLKSTVLRGNSIASSKQKPVSVKRRAIIIDKDEDYDDKNVDADYDEAYEYWS